MKIPNDPKLRRTFLEKEVVPLFQQAGVANQTKCIVQIGHFPHEKWEQEGRPVILQVETIVTHENILAVYDTAYGNVLVFDSRRNKVLYGRDPIVHLNFIVLGTFHGYDDKPVIFKRMT